MDTTIFRDLTYGMYIVTSKDNDLLVGCVVNTVTQITSEDIIVSVSINKNNYTNEILRKSKKIGISILSENTSKDTIVEFGYKTSKDYNKFENNTYEMIENTPIITNNICGYLIGDVINIVDANTHDIFLIKVTNCKKVNDFSPMSYSYYHKVLKGSSPKNAPTYQKEESSKEYNKYECIICGHIYDEEQELIKFEDLPDDWKCPTCGVGKDKFRKL